MFVGIFRCFHISGRSLYRVGNVDQFATPATLLISRRLDQSGSDNILFFSQSPSPPAQYRSSLDIPLCLSNPFPLCLRPFPHLPLLYLQYYNSIFVVRTFYLLHPVTSGGPQYLNINYCVTRSDLLHRVAGSTDYVTGVLQVSSGNVRINGTGTAPCSRLMSVRGSTDTVVAIFPYT